MHRSNELHQHTSHIDYSSSMHIYITPMAGLQVCKSAIGAIECAKGKGASLAAVTHAASIHSVMDELVVWIIATAAHVHCGTKSKSR